MLAVAVWDWFVGHAGAVYATGIVTGMVLHAVIPKK